MASARLDADLHGTATGQTKYHSMIGGLMYLITSRPDISFATFLLLLQYLGSTFNNYGTLKLDDSNDKFKSFIDTMEFKFSVDEFRRVFQLSQPTDINHVEFVDPPTFIEMLPFFKNELRYNTPIRLLGQSVTKGLPQLCRHSKRFSQDA
ncbi:hypothetical protein Tco_0502910 [Tanacetum coccineum]